MKQPAIIGQQDEAVATDDPPLPAPSPPCLVWDWSEDGHNLVKPSIPEVPGGHLAQIVQPFLFKEKDVYCKHV